MRISDTGSTTQQLKAKVGRTHCQRERNEVRAKRISSSDREESYKDNDYKRARYNKSVNDSDNSYNSDVRVPFTDIPILDEGSLMEMAMELGSKTNENQPCIEVEQVDYNSPEDPIVNPSFDHSLGNTQVFETSKETKLVNSNGVGVSLQSLSKKIKTDAGEITGESVRNFVVGLLKQIQKHVSLASTSKDLLELRPQITRTLDMVYGIITKSDPGREEVDWFC